MFIKKIFLRFKEDSLKQFLSRAALHLILIYPKIKAGLFLLILKLKEKKRWIIQEINGNKMLLDITDKGISKDLLYKNIREPRCTSFIKNFVNRDDICVDIGANIGYYALIEAKLVGPQGKIYAIEPVEKNFKILKKNIEFNKYENIEAYRLAIGSKNEIGFINLSGSSNLHSLLPGSTTLNNKTEQVEIMTLDEFLKDKPFPNFIRMDVEGYEEEIIKGMKQILRAERPLKMFIELHSFMLKDGGKELLEALERAHFRIAAVFNERHALMTNEGVLLVRGYDFFLKGIGIFNNTLENFNIPIHSFLKKIDKLKRNSFSIFLERN